MVRSVNEEKAFKRKAHSIRNPHERCKFLVSEFITLSSYPRNKTREKTIKKLLVSLSGANCPEAFLYLGKFYYLPNSNYEKAYNAFRNSIKNKYPLAYYEIGYMVENGYGCRKSKEKAVSCYMKAASCGSIDAMYRLGSAYLYRELGLNSVPKGIKYLDKATVLGHGEAAYKLSNIYETGIEGYLDKSENLALHYLQESAELSYTPALDKLGWTYENGRLGNVKDSSKAFYYYMKASNNGYSQSMYSLAGLIMDNANIDDRLAYDWMLKATMVTEPLNKAFYGMGVFYEYGVGVAKNLVAALDWYKKARDNNVPDAEQKIKDLEYKINATLSDNSQTSSDKSNLEDNKTNVNSNNRESLAVSNYSSEYTYSPIVMPSPAISVKKENKNQNVIITKDQLKDMNLTINSDGKVVYLNNKSSEEVVDPEMTHSTLSPISSSSSIKLNSENINAIMEPAKQTEKDIKKLSVDVSGKVVVVNVDANDVEQEKFYKPKLFKMDSQGNIESLSASSSTFNTNNNGVSEDELKNDMEEKLNISNDDKKKEQHVVLNVPDSYSLDSNNLIIPTRLSSYAIANDKEQFEAANSNSNEQTFVNNGEDNENDNDYYGDDDDNDDKDNEDEQFLNADDDNNDPFTDITSEFKYDPVKLNSDSIDNINESSKIKASKSVKTYIALPKRYESHTNPITNGLLENENINPESTISTSVFVDHFKNLTNQQFVINAMRNSSSFIDHKESRRVFQEEVKLSDKERDVNNNDWVERHPTILSITTDSSDVKFRQNSQNSISSSDFSGRFSGRFSDLSNTATINFPIHKQESIFNQYSSNVSSPLAQSSSPVQSQKMSKEIV
ncbi:HCP-like protein [Neocallimastix lanati (nom. inval.)]|nr:HCP-like protein [Neocallimastix sp. JGI-2020a]